MQKLNQKAKDSSKVGGAAGADGVSGTSQQHEAAQPAPGGGEPGVVRLGRHGGLPRTLFEELFGSDSEWSDSEDDVPPSEGAAHGSDDRSSRGAATPAAPRAAPRPMGRSSPGASPGPDLPDLPDDPWLRIIELLADNAGLRAGKMLRQMARVSRVFAQAAREHPDNNLPSVG